MFIDIEFIDTGVSQNVAKLGGKGQNSMSWMIVSPRPELINKLVRQTHEWHLLEGLVRYWYTFLRKYKRVPHPGGGGPPGNDSYGEVPTERGASVNQASGIGKGKELTSKSIEFCHFGLKKGPKGPRDAFYGFERVVKTF